MADSPEVGDSGRIGILSVTFPETALSDGEEVSATLWGYEDQDLGAPQTLRDGEHPAAAGEAVGTYGDFELGETVTVVGADGTEAGITVVGLAADSQLAVSPTLFLDYADFEDAALAKNPSAKMVLPSLIAVAPSSTDAAVVEDLRAASVDLDPLTRADAAAEFPGAGPVDQQRAEAVLHRHGGGVAFHLFFGAPHGVEVEPVSYTHLTLPTIYSV